jgi:prepilin-type N-terminal cleavage/methylation domain-containing protein
MIPPCRAVALAEADCRAAPTTKAELAAKPRDNKTTRQHGWSPVVSFRLVDTSSSESGQLYGSPSSICPSNTENRSAAGRIGCGEQRITAKRGTAPISAFQGLQRFPLTSNFQPPWLAVANQRRRLTSGFTLIELTVVILIIAALAALLMTGASSVFDRARKTQAKNDETQIVTAVNAYYTEYGKYPMADANQGTDTLYGKSGTAPGNEDVFNVLRAIATGVNASDVLNLRKIIFFSGKDAGSRPRSAFATVATTDAQGNPINIGAFADPFGNAYMVAIDGSYDGGTMDSLPYTDVTYATGNTVRIGCFAESFGKDGKQGKDGNKVYSGSDDILSWQ